MFRVFCHISIYLAKLGFRQNWISEVYLPNLQHRSQTQRIICLLQLPIEQIHHFLNCTLIHFNTLCEHDSKSSSISRTVMILYFSQSRVVLSHQVPRPCSHVFVNIFRKHYLMNDYWIESGIERRESTRLPLEAKRSYSMRYIEPSKKLQCRNFG